MGQKEIHNSALPFTVRVKHFFVNSTVAERPANSVEPPAATQGLGAGLTVKEEPRVTQTDLRDMPSVVIEVVGPQGSCGTWLVSWYLNPSQTITLGQHTWQISLRLRRYYQPFSLQLLQFRHDVYPGTVIPKNYSSRVRLLDSRSGENREALIYMNNPLRYAGETFYQSSYDEDNHGSVLQVVHNPSWLTPYFSCVLVGLGLVVHFATHLMGFAFKRRTA
jgi:hypothetical protein